MSYKKKLQEKVELDFFRERALYVALLEKFKWDRMKAAKALKMSRPNFYRKLRDLSLTKLTPKEWRQL